MPILLKKQRRAPAERKRLVPCIVRPSFVLLLSVGVCLAPVVVAPSRTEEPNPEVAKFEAIARSDTMLMMPMRDGTGLATDVYLPKDRDGTFPLIFVKTPYDFNRVEGVQLEWGIEAIGRGYATNAVPTHRDTRAASCCQQKNEVDEGEDA